ncbi:MAG: DegV family EDD domain-containing protein [Caldisericia bacterium]|nr:DegV family EDD domain-containing protein [Caldisericia bacterium]
MLKKVALIDANKFAEMLSRGAKELSKHTNYLNQINYFPVPDADTGTNLTKTVLQLSTNHTSMVCSTVAQTSKAIAESVLMSAKGNSGAILAQFFQGLANGLKECNTANLHQFSNAVFNAAQESRKAVVNPVEGTILTVMHDWAAYLKNNISETKDFVVHLKKAQKIAEVSLKNTVNQLKVLKKAKRVDAGAQGFVYLIQGFVEYLTMGHLFVQAKKEEQETYFHPDYDFTNAKYQYCTEVLIVGKDINKEEIKNDLSQKGDSLIVIGSSDKVKIHIHTDDPGFVFKLSQKYGQLAQEKVDDMYQQVRDVELSKKQKICLVVDSVCNLEPSVLKRYNIHWMPLRVKMGDINHYDSLTISSKEFFKEMAKQDVVPQTSQVTVADAERLLSWTNQMFDHTIVLTMPSINSGTFRSAQIAAKEVSPDNITVIDSFNGSGSIGLIAIEASKLIQKGSSLQEVVSSIHENRKKVRTFVTMENLVYLFRGGRVSKTKYAIANMLRMTPFIRVSEIGKMYQAGGFIGGALSVRKKLLKKVYKETKGMTGLKFMITHTVDYEKADWVKKELEKNVNVQSIDTAPMSPTMGTHGGPGTLVISWL